MRGSMTIGARDRGALLLSAGQRDARARRPSCRSPSGNRRRPCRGARRRRPRRSRIVAFGRRSPSARGSPTASRLTCRLTCRPVDRIQPERDVVGERVGEQERLLRHEADRAAQNRRAEDLATSTPSMKTVPGGGSCSRASSEISVDLPEPVTPTSATVCPASIVADT